MSQSTPLDEDTLAQMPGVQERGLRWLMWLLPLALAVDIVLSLWVSRRHVTHSVIVQVEPVWVPGERLALRGQLVDHDRDGVDAVEVSAHVESGGRSWTLGEMKAVPGGGLNQGAFEVPADLPTGAASLRVDFRGKLPRGGEVELSERIEVGVVETRAAHEAIHTINASILNWADDTSPQPKALRIDLQPYGRLLAGFDNTLMVRVTDPQGLPVAARLRIELVGGEFGGEVGPGEADYDANKGRLDPIFEGETDALGLARFDGRMDSDVVRLEIAAEPLEESPVENPVAAPADPPPSGETPPPPRRRFRMVSFSGGVRLFGDPAVAAPGAEVELEGASLQVERPIYVDVHGPDGAWIDTFMPPLRPYEAPRKWSLPGKLGAGFVHFEGYGYTNAPGQSAEVHRVLVVPEGGDALEALVKAQRERLDLPREKTGFDPAIERRNLDALAQRAKTPAERESARAWLMGSLPVEVHGPPLAVQTRAREEAAVEAWKRSWTVGLRWFLWGGGVLVILVSTVSLLRQQRRLVQATRQVLDDAGDSMSISARGDLLTRGLVMIGLLSGALVLTAMMLESLVWKF